MSAFVFTCGDINGIGPEIVIRTIAQVQHKNSIFIIPSPSNIFENTYQKLNQNFPYRVVKKVTPGISDQVIVLDLGKAKQVIGEPTKISGETAYNSIIKSFELVDSKIADAIITAPISKYAFSLADINYPGHTELYAELARVKHFIMMFISPKMKCALVTIHEPIKKISSLLKKSKLENTINVLVNTLKQDFHIEQPTIAVLGLNPHAGENGNIGDEEEKVINPVILNSDYSRFVTGPFVPDAFFGQHIYKKFDIVLGMYHDQVLIPFKMLDFNRGVNYTAGLPFVRTSPDHGTAFNIAGQYIADPSSMIEAFHVADKIVRNRAKLHQ